MKPIYIKLIAALVLIGSLIAVYFIFGDIVFNQTHNIDQEVEHSMDGITAIKIKKCQFRYYCIHSRLRRFLCNIQR